MAVNVNVNVHDENSSPKMAICQTELFRKQRQCMYYLFYEMVHNNYTFISVASERTPVRH